MDTPPYLETQELCLAGYRPDTENEQTYIESFGPVLWDLFLDLKILISVVRPGTTSAHF